MAAHVARPAAVSGSLVRSPSDRTAKAHLKIEDSLAQWLSALTVRDPPPEDPSAREEQKETMVKVLFSTLRSVPDQKTANSTALPSSSIVAAEVGQVISRSNVGVTEATEGAASHGDGAGKPQEKRKPGSSDSSRLRKSHRGLGCLHESSGPSSNCSSESDSDRGNGSGGQGPREPTSSEGAILATVFRPLPQVHQFSPFHPGARASICTNREVARRLRRPLTGTDLARKKGKIPTGEGQSSSDLRGGFVYVFTLPDAVAVCPPTRHVKIGMTTQRAVASRLAQIRGRCGYAPVLVAAAWTRHPLRVEELAHAQLGNRRRLQPAGCPGCGSRHREWFEIGADEASDVVRVWASWVERRMPYDDETGQLREEWRRRLPETLPEDPAFWKPFAGADVPAPLGRG